ADGQDFDLIALEGRRHVADRSRRASDEARYGLLGVELGWRELAPGENTLLPVAAHGRDRTLEHEVRERAPHARVGPQVDRTDGLAGVPAGSPLEEHLRHELGADRLQRVARVNDQLKLRHGLTGGARTRQ